MRYIKNKIRRWKAVALGGVLLWGMMGDLTAGRVYEICSEDWIDSATLVRNRRDPMSLVSEVDTLPFLRRFIQRVEVETRPGYVVPTNTFLRGENASWQPIRNSMSLHLKYSFQFRPGTYTDRIYGGAYQGAGIAFYTFGDRKQLGDPVAFYLFQGARIKQFLPWLSLHYEWNFGLSCGWKPYNYDYNSYNRMIGSKVNAYLNVNFYLNWMLSRRFDLTSGVTLTHFSNGNTRFPNAGLNAVGVKIGLAYHFNREASVPFYSLDQAPIPGFPRHVSYDLVFFGSWRRKGVSLGEEQMASPEAYTVAGFNFAPMYNLGYKFRVGVSLDGVYDGSANVYTKDYIVGTQPDFYKPSLYKQIALGLSGRAEYVMPYFTVGLGLGANVLHAGGDLKGFYQILALKIEVTRNSFLHIGYNLKDFKDPNFLMLGFGFRFNNRYPVFHR